MRIVFEWMKLDVVRIGEAAAIIQDVNVLSFAATSPPSSDGTSVVTWNGTEFGNLRVPMTPYTIGRGEAPNDDASLLAVGLQIGIRLHEAIAELERDQKVSADSLIIFINPLLAAKMVWLGFAVQTTLTRR